MANLFELHFEEYNVKYNLYRMGFDGIDAFFLWNTIVILFLNLHEFKATM